MKICSVRGISLLERASGLCMIYGSQEKLIGRHESLLTIKMAKINCACCIGDTTMKMANTRHLKINSLFWSVAKQCRIFKC